MLVFLLLISYIIFTFNTALVTSEIVTVTDDNWNQIMEGEWMVEFYAPWCPACQSLKPTWKEFAGWSKDLDISVGVVDITTSPVLTGRCLITALPTIYHIKDGKFRQFKGSRATKDFLDFIEEKQWEKLEVLEGMYDPGSVQMGVLGFFFKLSYAMKDLHKVMTEDYKFSTWISYAFFTLVTILVGGLLGLVAVLCLDCFRFPRQDEVPISQALKPTAKQEKPEDNSGKEKKE